MNFPKVSAPSLVDISVLISAGLLIYTLNPWMAIPVISLLAIRELKDYAHTKNIADKIDKCLLKTNEIGLQVDQETEQLQKFCDKFVQEANGKIKDMSSELKASKESINSLKTEFNKIIIRNKELFGDER